MTERISVRTGELLAANESRDGASSRVSGAWLPEYASVRSVFAGAPRAWIHVPSRSRLGPATLQRMLEVGIFK